MTKYLKSYPLIKKGFDKGQILTYAEFNIDSAAKLRCFSGFNRE